MSSFQRPIDPNFVECSDAFQELSLTEKEWKPTQQIETIPSNYGETTGNTSATQQQRGAAPQASNPWNASPAQHETSAHCPNVAMGLEKIQPQDQRVKRDDLPRSPRKRRRRRQNKEYSELSKFIHLVEEILSTYDALMQIHFQESAIRDLREAAEAFMITFFEECTVLAKKNNRVTVRPEDIRQLHEGLLATVNLQTPLEPSTTPITGFNLSMVPSANAAERCELQHAGATLE